MLGSLLIEELCLTVLRTRAALDAEVQASACTQARTRMHVHKHTHTHAHLHMRGNCLPYKTNGLRGGVFWGWASIASAGCDAANGKEDGFGESRACRSIWEKS